MKTRAVKQQRLLAERNLETGKSLFGEERSRQKKGRHEA